MTSNVLNSQNTQSGFGQNVKQGLLGGVVAALISLVVFFIGNAAVGPISVAMQPGMPVEPLPWFMVIVATLIAGLAGAVLLTILQRVTQNGTRIFQGLAVVVTLLSLFPPITQSGDAGAAVVLSLLHVITAVAIVWALTLR